MLAGAKSFSFMSNCDENNFKYEVPFFQRPYVWTKDNWEDLLNDLSKEQQHFLGSIILKKAGDSPVHYVIIDGQQRITTISILLKVIYDILKPINKLSYEQDHWIKDSLFISQGSNGNQIRLQHSYHDIKQFDSIIGKIETDKDDISRTYILSPEFGAVSTEIKKEVDIVNSLLQEGKKEKEFEIDNNNLIRSCYKYFLFRLSYIFDEQKNKYEKISYENDIKLNQVLFSLFCQKLFVIITVDENEHEQEIFDTINSAGIRLSCTDIIKNKLYEKYKFYVNSPDETLEFYNNTWQQTFETADKYEFWTTEKNVGRNLRTNLELFFQAFGIIYETNEKIYDVEKDTLSTLADNFKKYIDKLQTKNEIENFVKDIMQDADIYFNLPKFDPETGIQFNDIEKRVACIMKTSNNTTFTPYLLYLYKNYNTEEKKNILNEKLKFIDNVLMHYIISGKSNKNFNKYCTDLIDDDKKAGRNTSKELNNITYEEMEKGVKNKKNNTLAKLILFFIELHRDSAKGSKSNFTGIKFTDGLELEHILPKKWEDYWCYDKSPYYSDDGEQMSNDNAGKKNRNEKLYSLGNMTILCSGINKDIKNKDFRTKIEGFYTKKKEKIDGIKATIEHEFSITREYVEKAADEGYVWNEQKIAEREKRLLDEILEIWPLETISQ